MTSLNKIYQNRLLRHGLPLLMFVFSQCQPEYLFVSISIIPPDGCLGEQLLGYEINYSINNSQGFIEGDTAKDSVILAAAGSARCIPARSGREIVCPRRLRPSAALLQDAMQLMVQVDATDADTRAVVLRGQAQDTVALDGRAYQLAVKLAPVQPPQGGMVRLRALPSGTTKTLWSVWTSSPGNAWTVGKEGTTLHWDRTHPNIGAIPSATLLRAIFGTSQNDLWAAGSQGSLYRYVADQWLSQVPLGTQSLNAIAGTSTHDLWAVGDAATIFHFDGVTWRPERSLFDTGRLSLVENISAISVDAAGNALAVGLPIGLAISYSATTKTWTRPVADLGAPLYDVWISSPTDGWAVGSGAYQWNGSWKQINCDTQGRKLKGVWGLSGEQVWATGEDGAIYRLRTSGCERVETNSSMPLYDIWGTSQDLWVVGENGTVIYGCISQ